WPSARPKIFIAQNERLIILGCFGLISRLDAASFFAMVPPSPPSHWRGGAGQAHRRWKMCDGWPAGHAPSRFYSTPVGTDPDPYPSLLLLGAHSSLAFTLRNEPSELDDGLLTASEVAQLKLNADWVVLSACNTAAGEKPGAEALSGLARAFFYAGARALLVSHWRIDSKAATRLTTSTFDIMKSNQTISRAEA